MNDIEMLAAIAAAGEPDPTAGLPPDLARVLRDQSVIVPQDASVFELIAKWTKAPSDTASALPPPDAAATGEEDTP